MPRSKRPASSDYDYESADPAQTSAGASSGNKMQELLFDVLARWPWLVVGIILGVLGGLYYFSKAPKIYEATSTLVVTQQGGDVGGVGNSSGLDTRSTEGMNTLALRITNLEFLERVAEVLKNNETAMREGFIPPEVDWLPAWSRDWLGDTEEATPPDPKTMEPSRLANFIRRWTRVRVVDFTRLVEITVAHQEAELASLIADTIAVEYEAMIAEERSTSLISSSTILSQEAATLKKAIQEDEKILANYETTLEALTKLDTIQEEFDRLKKRYKHKHPKYIESKAALQNQREIFLDEFRRVRTSAFDQEYWQEHEAEIDDESLSEDDQIRVRRSLLRARTTTLVNSVNTEKNVMSELTSKALRSMADRGSDAIGVESSSKSQVPGQPAKPKQQKIVTTGGLAGFGASLLFVLLLVKLDNQVHTVAQAENLTGLPVLATIRLIEPKILSKIIKDKGKRKEAGESPTRKWDPHLVFRPGLIDTLYAETFRILRASVALLGDEKRRNVTLFSSVLPGEGKSLVSSNFAIASAQQGKKTLLIDLDLRKPAVHKNFGIHRKDLSNGITELLAKQITWREAVTTETGQENLSCLFAGGKAPNPGELLSSNTIEELLRTLEAEFDVIVIDSAPILAVPDTRLIIPAVDNFCLVIRAEQTPTGAVRKGLSLMEDDGTTPAGVVINAYEEKAGLLTRKYRYGYGYGGYGQYYGDNKGSYGTYGSDDDDD